MKLRLLLIALLAVTSWPSPAAAATPPLRLTGQNQTTWYEPAPARECRKILARRPSVRTNYVGCRYRFVRTRMYYEIIDYLAVGEWRFSQNNVRMTGPFSVWSVDADIMTRYDGSSVFKEWQRCRWSGVAFTVKVNDCPLWNDGGGRGFGYLEFGADFNVSFLVEGFPVSFSHWIRADVGLTGQGFHVTND